MTFAPHAINFQPLKTVSICLQKGFHCKISPAHGCIRGFSGVDRTALQKTRCNDYVLKIIALSRCKIAELYLSLYVSRFPRCIKDATLLTRNEPAERRDQESTKQAAYDQKYTGCFIN
jgi:hypothetical protein